MNAVLRPLFDLLLFPFRGLPAIVGVTVVSLVVAIGMLLLFKATSNQEAIDRVKRKIHAGLFEIRLFNDDLRAIFRAMGQILRHNVVYIGYAMLAFVWILPPLVLVVAQLQFHYGYQSHEVGDTTILSVVLEEGWDGGRDAVEGENAPRPEIGLELPDGLAATAPPVWIPSERQLAWRLEVEQQGDFEIGVSFDGATHTKTMVVSDRIRRLSPERFAPGFWDQLIYPAEAALPGDSGIAEISFRYPDREVWLLGWRTHWLIVFFVLSLVFAFALRNRLGVAI